MKLEAQMLKLLKEKPSTRKELHVHFSDNETRIINSALSSLIFSGKLLCKKNIFSVAPKKSKMGNIRVEHDGIKFDSKKEGKRYLELKMLRDTGIIQDLKLQVPVVVIDSIEWNGKKLSAIKYLIDFTYIDKDGILTAEDVKGRVLGVYRIKRQLFLQRYPEYRFIET